MKYSLANTDDLFYVDVDSCPLESLSMPNVNDPQAAFCRLELKEPLLKALQEEGYETPTPVQQRTIPVMLEGQDLIGQAQTGTGKTAAFALPLLNSLEGGADSPAVLVLTPTRELAIQVGDSFRTYGRHLPGVRGITLYGGANIGPQLQGLRAGVDIVVGTPGRVMDHLRRGSLSLANLRCIVLDEADEMLRMGFIDDVEWILEQTPENRQTALFSATMPSAIQRIARRHLRSPVHIKLDVKNPAAKTVRQRYCVVRPAHKQLALERILTVEQHEGILIFVRTRSSTTMVAEALRAQGHEAVALNGDIAQRERERTVEALRNGRVDIVVATDVAARGLDVDRISHVVNFDVPTDAETYVHRIGRTGRAGRTGEALMFIAPDERRRLAAIERTLAIKIESMSPPSASDVQRSQQMRLKGRVEQILDDPRAGTNQAVVATMASELGITEGQVAAALMQLLTPNDERSELDLTVHERPTGNAKQRHRDRLRDGRSDRASVKRDPRDATVEEGMVRYRIEVGSAHGAHTKHIVGAIANEGGLEGRYIGKIQIHDQFTLVDLPDGMPQETHQVLGRTWVCARQLRLREIGSSTGPKRKPRNPERSVRPARAKRKTKAHKKKRAAGASSKRR